MARSKIKIICVIPSLVGGGAEKIMITLLNNFSRDSYDLSLVLFEAKGVYMEMIPSDIKVITLGKKNRFDFFALALKLCRVFSQEKPDVVLSFLWYANLITIIAKKLSSNKPPVIVGVRNVMTKLLKEERGGWFKGFLIRKLYPYADIVTVLSNTMRDDMERNFMTPAGILRVLLNPMDISKIEALSAESPDHPWFSDDIPVIISVGRLHVQKDFPTLIKAFATLRKNGSFRLIILGEGGDRDALTKLITELNLSDSIELPGFAKNPYSYIKKSALFVMSSTHEGLPGALIEAMICGTPVVACACPSTAEVISDNVNGLLSPVSDPDALCAAMLRILDDETLSRRLAQRGRHDCEKYALKKILSEYDEMFYGLAGKK